MTRDAETPPDGRLAEAKAAARAEALARRKAAQAAAADGGAARRIEAHLLTLLDEFRGAPVAGYLPIGSEVDVTGAMAELSRSGPVAVPVVEAKAAPLRFREWRPGVATRPGAFGVPVPEQGAWLEPRVVIVPLLAFDPRGFRLGYGGGFYDRTLEALRRRGRVLAVGVAYEAQLLPEIPLEPTDQPLDAVVTERGPRRF
ncbi:MAG: 5-formyltetrahydrofolate cyclo-ligase [Alphaproteobacteria bacterium]|nr:MAG: 5-formyltetrahydrofolate cyclo-ligase [Alphaproteobacteria bacterium]